MILLYGVVRSLHCEIYHSNINYALQAYQQMFKTSAVVFGIIESEQDCNFFKKFSLNVTQPQPSKNSASNLRHMHRKLHMLRHLLNTQPPSEHVFLLRIDMRVWNARISAGKVRLWHFENTPFGPSDTFLVGSKQLITEVINNFKSTVAPEQDLLRFCRTRLCSKFEHIDVSLLKPSTQTNLTKDFFLRSVGERRYIDNVQLRNPMCCFDGNTQRYSWSPSNFAHYTRGYVVPVLSELMKSCYQTTHVYTTTAYPMAIKMLENFIKVSIVSKCDPQKHVVKHLQASQHLREGASLIYNNPSCSLLPGASLPSVYHWPKSSPDNIHVQEITINDRSQSKRDILNWPSLKISLQETFKDYKVQLMDVGLMPIAEQLRVIRKTNFIMHHGSANNFRFFMRPHSFLVETQPGSAWFCGHAVAKDDIVYVLSMDSKTDMYEESSTCYMYTPPKANWTAKKDVPRNVHVKALVRLTRQLIQKRQNELQRGCRNHTYIFFESNNTD